MYCIKLMRFCGMWLSIYIGRRFFSDDYVDTTIFSGDPSKLPRHLTEMVRTSIAIQIVFECIIATMFVLARNLKDSNDNYLIPMLATDQRFILMYVIDAGGTLAMTATMSYIIARVMGDRTVFDYVEQGTRAARALEEIMVNIAAIVCLIPFFLMV